MGKFDALFQAQRGPLAAGTEDPVATAMRDLQTAPQRGDEQPPAPQKNRRRARPLKRRKAMVGKR